MLPMVSLYRTREWFVCVACVCVSEMKCVAFVISATDVCVVRVCMVCVCMCYSVSETKRSPHVVISVTYACGVWCVYIVCDKVCCLYSLCNVRVCSVSVF